MRILIRSAKESIASKTKVDFQIQTFSSQDYSQEVHIPNQHPIADENISFYSTTSNSSKCRVIEDLEDKLFNAQLLSKTLEHKSEELEKQIQCLKLTTSALLFEEKQTYNLKMEALKTQISNMNRLVYTTQNENEQLQQRIFKFESGEELTLLKNKMT